MTDQNTTVATTSQSEVKPVTSVQTEEQTKSDVKAAYTISLKTNNEFQFDVTGSDPTLVDLLALHQLAQQKIEDITNQSHMRAHGLTHTMLNELAQLVKAVGQLVASQAQLNKPGGLVLPNGAPLLTSLNE